VIASLPRGAARMQGRFRLLHLAEDGAAALEVLPALVGEMDPPGGAVQERRAELAL
jgi:hypothetical protein